MQLGNGCHAGVPDASIKTSHSTLQPYENDCCADLEDAHFVAKQYTILNINYNHFPMILTYDHVVNAFCETVCDEIRNYYSD